MKAILANVIFLMHILLIVFMVAIPFLNIDWPFLMIHFMLCTTLIVHWLAHDDTCFLTWLESTLRGVPPTESFVYKLVSPVYKISDETVKILVIVSTIILGVVSAVRLKAMWPKISADVRKTYPYFGSFAIFSGV